MNRSEQGQKSIAHRIRWLMLISAAMLSACSFAPAYERPSMTIPPHYKETGKWISAKPLLTKATAQKAWWTLFKDPTLTALEQKVTCGNENLKVAYHRYQEACAILQSKRSQLYPAIQAISNATRQQNSGRVANSRDLPILLYDTYALGATLNYEIDAWGSVRNAVMASDKQAIASKFDLTAISLSMHALLASNYFQLRGQDEAQIVLDKTVVAYEKALHLTQQLHKGGAAPAIDVDQAITQLENTKTLATETRLQRAQLEHAIAVLLGEIPANFHIQTTHTRMHLVTVSPDLPSTLLKRRPDVAAAEKRMEAANATIGVARAAFFPQLNLSGMIGFQSSSLSNLISTPSLIWALGPPTSLIIAQPEVSQVLFDGYNLQALLKKANAVFFETVSAYRQTTLTAFQEVEDSLVAIHRLDEERLTQRASTAAALRALYQANKRYRGGIATFLNVVITENEALQSELALITIQTRRQVASVLLIKALGGGFEISNA